MRTTVLGSAIAVGATVAMATLAGCSSSSSPATTAPTTTSAVLGLPATGSVDGVILSVTSSPRTGKVGATTITATAELKGTVSDATLRFAISSASSADKGKAASVQTVNVSGPGRFTLPKPYKPSSAGHWSVTVTYTPKAAGKSSLSVSGEPPVAGSQPPFPQLVTVVSS